MASLSGMVPSFTAFQIGSAIAGSNAFNICRSLACAPATSLSRFFSASINAFRSFSCAFTASVAISKASFTCTFPATKSFINFWRLNTFNLSMFFRPKMIVLASTAPATFPRMICELPTKCATKSIASANFMPSTTDCTMENRCRSSIC